MFYLIITFLSIIAIIIGIIIANKANYWDDTGFLIILIGACTCLLFGAIAGMTAYEDNHTIGLLKETRSIIEQYHYEETTPKAIIETKIIDYDNMLANEKVKASRGAIFHFPNYVKTIKEMPYASEVK